MPKKKTHAEYVDHAKGFGVTVLERYTGSRQKILISCDKCGHEWRSRVDHILEGKGCPECMKTVYSKLYKKPSPEFLLRLASCNVSMVSEYKGRGDSIKLECGVCGKVWSINPGGTKCSCPSCRSKLSGEKNRRPPSVLNDYGAYVGLEATCGTEFFVDKIDVKLIEYSTRLDQNGYPMMSVNRSTQFIHKLILNAPDKMVDHKDRNPLNNRRNNLRYATKSQNAMNSSYVRGKSGLRGVTHNEKTRRWKASIHIKGVTHYLGYFDNVDFAIGARRQAELKYFGEFAPE